MRRLSLVLVGLWSLVGGLSAQASAPATASTPSTASEGPAAPLAQAYDAQEFPPWVLKVRRAEILTVGAFPLAYLFAGLGYDYLYYLTNGFPQGNIPWPAGPGTSQWNVTDQPDQVQEKNLTLVGLSLGLSLLVAGADWLLGQ